MSDNTTIPPGSGGDTIRTIDRALDVPPGSSKTQVVALDIGGESSESLVSGSLPVSASTAEGLLNQILMTMQAMNLQLANLTSAMTAGDGYIDPSNMTGGL
jgi:hypothetical protein